MSMYNLEDENHVQERRVVPFRQGIAIRGGGGPPLGDNWLQDLPEGTVFFTRPRNDEKQPFLTPWRLIQKAEDAPIAHIVTLIEGKDGFVDTHRFSALMSCVCYYAPEGTNDMDNTSGSRPDPDASNVVSLFEID